MTKVLDSIKVVLNKIKGFYIWFFSKVVIGFKKVVVFNKSLIDNIKQDFESKEYVTGICKSIGYSLVLIVQIVLAVLLVLSYVLCKLTGVCLII